MNVLHAVPLASSRRPVLSRGVRARAQQPCRIVRVAAGGPTRPDEKNVDSKGGILNMLRVKLTPEDERTFRKAMQELKLDTPSKLRGFLLRRSGTATLALLVDLGIQSIGAASSYALFTMLLHSPNQSWWLKAGAALSAFGAGWFLTSISADLVVMTLVIGTSLRLGLSADALLELVEGPREKDGPWRNPVQAAQRMQASLETTRLLSQVRSALVSQPYESGSEETLGAYFALAAAEARGFDPASLHIDEKEAMRIAAAFKRYDADGDDAINAAELRALTSELTRREVSMEEAEEELRALDKSGKSVSLEQWAQWWTTQSVEADQAR